MLGYVIIGQNSGSDFQMSDLVEALCQSGYTVAGAVQENEPIPNSTHCEMDLRLVGHAQKIRITQDLGTHSTGCRLDPQALELVVGLVEASLSDQTDLLVVNKFGKAETEGRGFRALIGTAIAAELPVFTSVRAAYLPQFLEFAGDLAIELPRDILAISAWLSDLKLVAQS